MGFSRQEYWSGLPFPALGHLPNPGIEPASLRPPALVGESFPLVPPRTFLTWDRGLLYLPLPEDSDLAGQPEAAEARPSACLFLQGGGLPLSMTNALCSELG